MTPGERELHEQLQGLRIQVWEQERAVMSLREELVVRDDMLRQQQQHLADAVDQLVQVLVNTLEDDEQPFFWELAPNLGIAAAHAAVVALRS